MFKSLTIFKEGKKLLQASTSDLSQAVKGMEEPCLAEEFFLAVNLCHECISVESQKSGKREFYGPSTDEACFLKMTREVSDLGFFVDRDSESLTIQHPSGLLKYKMLKYFPFTSERMASSCVVQSPGGQIFVFVKGADSSILKLTTEDTQDVAREAEIYASHGLRTLVFAYKQLPVTKNQSGSQDSDQALDGWADVRPQDVEYGLSILGVTAVEDLLQDRVAETLQDFKDAGMKVWMLTGDKGTTAEKIGIECGLIPQSSIKLQHSINTRTDSLLVKFRETPIELEIFEEI